MNGPPLLDTHAWVSWVERDGRLDSHTLDTLDGLSPDDRPHLCGISLWEVAMLVELKRLTFSIPLEEWLAASSHPRSVRLVPITPAIAAHTAMLPSTFHRDPADRLIVATCRVHGPVAPDERPAHPSIAPRVAPETRSAVSCQADLKVGLYGCGPLDVPEREHTTRSPGQTL